MAKQTDNSSQSAGLPRVRGGKYGVCPGKNSLRTVCVPAPPACDRHNNHDGTPMSRQIPEVPGITAVAGGRSSSARWATAIVFSTQQNGQARSISLNAMDFHSWGWLTACKLFHPAKWRVALKPATAQNLHRECSRTLLTSTRQ